MSRGRTSIRGKLTLIRKKMQPPYYGELMGAEKSMLYIYKCRDEGRDVTENKAQLLPIILLYTLSLNVTGYTECLVRRSENIPLYSPAYNFVILVNHSCVSFAQICIYIILRM